MYIYTNKNMYIYKYEFKIENRIYTYKYLINTTKYMYIFHKLCSYNKLFFYYQCNNK